MTILLTPFMSCSAKLPIYAVFTAAFFPAKRGAGDDALYVMGMVIGILCALIMKSTLYKGNPVPLSWSCPTTACPAPKAWAC